MLDSMAGLSIIATETNDHWIGQCKWCHWGLGRGKRRILLYSSWSGGSVAVGQEDPRVSLLGISSSALVETGVADIGVIIVVVITGGSIIACSGTAGIGN